MIISELFEIFKACYYNEIKYKQFLHGMVYQSRAWCGCHTIFVCQIMKWSASFSEYFLRLQHLILKCFAYHAWYIYYTSSVFIF